MDDRIISYLEDATGPVDSGSLESVMEDVSSYLAWSGKEETEIPMERFCEYYHYKKGRLAVMESGDEERKAVSPCPVEARLSVKIHFRKEVER